MTLNEKIINFLNDRNLSSTKFADEIGVPRPSISHITSGRNKPSLEIIQKIIKKYPELGFEWVLDDGVEMPSNRSQNNGYQRVNSQETINFGQRDFNDRKKAVPKYGEPNVGSNVFDGFVGQSNKKVDRIVVFYADNTFTTYTEGKTL